MKVLLVDDHVLIRDALRGVIKELTSEATVLEAEDSRQRPRRVRSNIDLGGLPTDPNLPFNRARVPSGIRNG